MDIEKLKTRIIIKSPFFGSLLHKLEHKIEDEKWFAANGIPPTACCDGHSVVYNDKWMDTLPTNQQMFVTCHEILHAAFLHTSRFTTLKNHGKDEDAIIFNIAADYLINDLLVNQMGLEMPKDSAGKNQGIIDDKYKFDDWTVEKLYHELKKTIKKIKISCSGWGGNDMLPDKSQGDKTEGELIRQEQDWKIAVNAAAQIAAKQKGALPASIQRLIDQLLKNKVDWKKELYDWASAKVCVSNTWNKVNRRFVSQGLYLPAKYSEGIGELIVGIDTSGSIGVQELTTFASELNYILEFVKPIKVTVVYCDAAVNKTVEYTMEDLPIKFEAVGGGGTDFRPVFNWVKKNRADVEIAGLIYMTDMYGDFPKEEPEYPVAWMATSKVKPPFGKYIEYPFGENT